jgi:acyl carrier protein
MNPDESSQPAQTDPSGGAAGTPPSGSDRRPPEPRSAADVEQWMVEYLARLLHTPADQIDVTVPFEQFALDSVQAVGMTGDLEEWLGVPVDPMAVYDHPTIERLAKYLAEQTQPG